LQEHLLNNAQAVLEQLRVRVVAVQQLQQAAQIQIIDDVSAPGATRSSQSIELITFVESLFVRLSTSRTTIVTSETTTITTSVITTESVEHQQHLALVESTPTPEMPDYKYIDVWIGDTRRLLAELIKGSIDDEAQVLTIVDRLKVCVYM
jgi:hypothetical protein